MQRGILTELQENKQTKAGLQWRLHALEARLKSKDNIIRELSDKVKSLSDGRDLAIMKMRKQVLDLQHELGKTGNDKTSFVDGDHIEDCIKTLDELMDLASVPAAEMTDARLERIRERSKELKKELKSLYPTLVSP
ncbi:hypothetical protein FOL47_005583 [Perkinsus chesapeaki]|uniref:Uncharacterized protein n=1 Tax=Perkinsus chesapeaki TaxID=330153 RepID=A0A7J6LWX0_PERCH|nr:hypothetical protein FOL47_005583 [Perkinsus chesapeaki]